MEIKTVFITGRKENKLALETAKKTNEFFSEKIKVITDKDFFGKGKSITNINADLILCFGGDGTLLKTFRDLKKRIPVMGINCGNIGFLHAFSADEIEKAVQKIISGKIVVEERTRILSKIDNKKMPDALNEVLIVPKEAGRIMRYSLKIADIKREEASDGLMLATPTGSTAHALSAGGPIVRGNAKVFVVVSINPVDWKHRPLIINDHEKTTISDFNSNATAVIDGQQRFPINKKIELVKGSSVLLAK